MVAAAFDAGVGARAMLPSAAQDTRRAGRR
jgi:hypothetical protein